MLFIIIYRLYVHKIFTHMFCITICMLMIFALWLGLRIEVRRNVMEVHKNLYLEVIFYFFSHLKEAQTGSLNPW